MRFLQFSLILALLSGVATATTTQTPQVDEMLLAFDILDNRAEAEVSSYDQMRLLVEPLRPGIARSEAEQLLPSRDYGPQRSSLTRYYHRSGYAIVVPYDTTGGRWNAANRVSGPITLLRVVR